MKKQMTVQRVHVALSCAQEEGTWLDQHRAEKIASTHAMMTRTTRESADAHASVPTRWATSTAGPSILMLLEGRLSLLAPPRGGRPRRWPRADVPCSSSPLLAH